MSRSPARRAAAPALTLALAAAGLPMLAPPALAVSPDVVLSEVYGGGGNSGATFRNDFIELRNLGAVAVDVTGWAVQYAGATGTSWQRTALNGTIPAGGKYLVQQAAGAGGTTDLPTPDVTGSIAMGASAGKVALTTTTTVCTGSACASPTLRDLIGYGAANASETAPTAALSNTTSASRTAGDTDDNAADFTVGPPTPESQGGTTPEPEPATACDRAPTHEVGAVQGTGAATPIAGQTVTVRGTVVGDLPRFDGFYLQGSDGDGATSDGVFVFDRTAAVDLGDTVAVTGRAGEFGGQTQISSVESDVCEDGSPEDLPAPAPLDLPADDATRERLEGMLVAPADGLTVSDVFDLTSFGELTLSEGGLLVQPTELARPGTAEAAALAAENTLRRIVLDDGVSARVTSRTRPYLSPATPVRVGDVLTFAAPTVLGYGFDQWRLQPSDGTAEGTFAPQDTRPTAPEPVGGDVTVGAFNVLNYFLTLQADGGRGARTSAELERQASKIVPAIDALGADVVTLMEIEDTDSTGRTPRDADGALADLVRRLNGAAGADTWSYVPLPEELYAVDRDVIRNAIIYKDDVVQPVGPPVGLVDESVWFNAREPQAQTFAKDGDRFTVVANHFKSKSPGKPTGDNVDAGDGQAEWNGDRVRQAQSLAAFTERLEQVDQDVLLLGDFNAYTQEDPIEELREAGFADLGERFDEGRYSYVFDDMSGSLDHALASAALTAKVTDVTHWNINAVESFAYQYTGDPALYSPSPYRSSDHDPLVLGIDLEERCQGLLPTIRGTGGDDVLTGTNGIDVIMGLGGDDVIDGGNDADVVCGGAGDDALQGGNGDDVLLGGLADDVLDGDNGDDSLVGGPGTDRLEQGHGTGVEAEDGAES